MPKGKGHTYANRYKSVQSGRPKNRRGGNTNTSMKRASNNRSSRRRRG